MTHDILRALLNDLGPNSERVAETLLARGCQGRRNNCRTCPVAVYLQRHGFLDVRVDVGFVSWQDEQGHWQFSLLPDAVAECVLRFDLGHYPELQRQTS